MDTVYYYWHSTEAPKPSKETDRGGFRHPFQLVLYGWKEHKATGRYPDPEELARRIKPNFVADIDYFNELIERGRPTPPDATK